MIVIKFSSLTDPQPSCVRKDVFNAGPPIVYGYWVIVGDNEIKLSDGDYIIQDDNGVVTAYYSASQYASDLNIKSIVTENVGKELTRNIWQALISSGLSGANKIFIANTIHLGITMVICGQIVDARAYVNSITPTGAFTTNVKTQILALMDAAIAKL